MSDAKPTTVAEVYYQALAAFQAIRDDPTQPSEEQEQANREAARIEAYLASFPFQMPGIFVDQPPGTRIGRWVSRTHVPGHSPLNPEEHPDA